MPDPVDWGLVLESPIFWGGSDDHSDCGDYAVAAFGAADHDSDEAEYDPKVMPGVAQSKQG